MILSHSESAHCCNFPTVGCEGRRNGTSALTALKCMSINSITRSVEALDNGEIDLPMHARTMQGDMYMYDVSDTRDNPITPVSHLSTATMPSGVKHHEVHLSIELCKEVESVSNEGHRESIVRKIVALDRNIRGCLSCCCGWSNTHASACEFPHCSISASIMRYCLFEQHLPTPACVVLRCLTIRVRLSTP